MRIGALCQRGVGLRGFLCAVGCVYIDCWEEELNAGEMSGKFRKREIYRELNLHYLEINRG